MKVYLANVFKIDDDYQEILIDSNNFGSIKLLQVFPIKQNIDGVTYDDVYVIEPECYYEVLLREDTPTDFVRFTAHDRLLRSGLIVSELNKRTRSIFIYNTTKNSIFIRPNAVIGEIE